VKRVSIFLIMVALIAGMVGCGGGGGGGGGGGAVQYYRITISSATGGTVTTPGEGLFSYAQGTVVTLVAEPDLGYRFVGWVGSADTIADFNAATTTITVNNSYFIIAYFRRI
jgi:hypothetical protein